MKKIILFAAILFAGVSVASAQTPNKTQTAPDQTPHTTVTTGSQLTDQTQLTVILNTIQSISVNTSNVTLEYKTVSDYQNGVNSGYIDNHLEVNSTGAYDVKVEFSSEGDSSYDNPDSGLTPEEMFKSIKVSVAKKVGGENATLYDTMLEKTATKSIITSTTGEFGATYNVDYIGGINYINSIKEGSTRTYTAQVTYTIAPK